MNLFREKKRQIVSDLKVKPRCHPGRVILDFGDAPKCVCRSSRKKNFIGFKLSCIQPNCSRYYKGFPSSDIDESSAVYLEGKLVSRWKYI